MWNDVLLASVAFLRPGINQILSSWQNGDTSVDLRGRENLRILIQSRLLTLSNLFVIKSLRTTFSSKDLSPNDFCLWNKSSRWIFAGNRLGHVFDGSGAVDSNDNEDVLLLPILLAVDGDRTRPRFWRFRCQQTCEKMENKRKWSATFTKNLKGVLTVFC